MMDNLRVYTLYVQILVLFEIIKYYEKDIRITLIVLQKITKYDEQNLKYENINIYPLSRYKV